MTRSFIASELLKYLTQDIWESRTDLRESREEMFWELTERLLGTSSYDGLSYIAGSDE